MTTETKKLIGVAVGGLVAGAVAAWLVLSGAAGDEEGIRVKNGSVVLETISADGFDLDTSDNKYKAKRRPRGPVFVAVTGGTCAGSSSAQPVTRLELRIDTRRVDVVAQGKFEVLPADFSLSGNLLTSSGRLAGIQAYRGANLVVDCTASAEQTMEAYVFVGR